jgi:hypothetical protein
MNRATFKVEGAGPYAAIVQSKLRGSKIEGGTVVLQSQLEDSASLNEHLVWLWGMLKHERRVLKQAAAGGAKLVCECSVSGGSVHVLPNGAEMLHLLGAELTVEGS